MGWNDGNDVLAVRAAAPIVVVATPSQTSIVIASAGVESMPDPMSVTSNMIVGFMVLVMSASAG